MELNCTVEYNLWLSKGDPNGEVTLLVRWPSCEVPLHFVHNIIIHGQNVLIDYWAVCTFWKVRHNNYTHDHKCIWRHLQSRPYHRIVNESLKKHRAAIQAGIPSFPIFHLNAQTRKADYIAHYITSVFLFYWSTGDIVNPDNACIRIEDLHRQWLTFHMTSKYL